jgi:hypothetical protein
MSDVLMAAIDKWYPFLRDASFYYNKKALLVAIAKNESSFGKHLGPRLEPAYDVRGYYFRRSYLIRNQYSKFGDAVAKSYGPFQIMYPVACELGFDLDESPTLLADFDINTQYAVEYINVRAIKYADSVEDIFDAYNSGSSRDQNIPVNYVNRGMRNYEAACREFPEA